MENLKIIKNKMIILLLFFGLIILFNSKSYAAIESPTNTLTVTLGERETYYWEVEGDSSNWTVWTDNNQILTVWKNYNYVYFKPLIPGTTNIYVRTKNPSYEFGRKIVINKPTKSTLTVYRGNGLTNQTQPLIVGFTGTWNISSKYGWKVSSPNAGIIKVTDYGTKSGKLQFIALDSEKRLDPGSNPGYTYIKITENYTGAWEKHWIQVKPYATSIHRKACNSNVKAGDSITAQVYTRPMNFVNISGHGATRWKTSDASIATVDQKGNIKFLKGGNNVTVKITATYSDGKHPALSADFNFKVSKPDSKLNVKYSNNNTVESSIDIFPNFSKTWKIESYKGWDISSPNNGIITLNWDYNKNIVTYTAKNTGQTTITIKEKYTEISKTFTINVIQNADSISILNKSAIKNKVVGDEFQLSAKTGPINYVERSGYGSVSWASSNTSIATVDRNTGLVKCNTNGVERTGNNFSYIFSWINN